MKPLDEIANILTSEGLLRPRPREFESSYQQALSNPQIRGILEISTPPISNLSDALHLTQGSVYAIRSDLTDSHKKNMVAGLILRQVMRGKIPRQGIDTFVDTGSINSALAIKHLSQKLGMNVEYVMSRAFNPKVVEMLEQDGGFVVNIAPKRENVDPVREYVLHLAELLKDTKFRKNKCYLNHTKQGWNAVYPIGREIAEQLEVPPDYIVLSVGSGSTLGGIGLGIKDYFQEQGHDTKIAVVEYETAPLFAQEKPYTSGRGRIPAAQDISAEQLKTIHTRDSTIHPMTGTHFKELNPFIPQRAHDAVHHAELVSEDEIAATQTYLKQHHGYDFGNTSAACIHAATHLANEGNNVLTMIFEPRRTIESLTQTEQTTRPRT